MRYIIGADEVGRGCVAGSVYVSAVLADEDAPKVTGVRDSKKLSPAARQKVYTALVASPHIRTTTSFRPAEFIDKFGISKALQECFFEAIMGLVKTGEKIAEVRVDGNPFPLPVPVPTRFIVKGDDSEYTIGAASIIAKVSRDFWMTDASKTHPGYGFEEHKGYGTPAHIEAIKKLGLSPLHRATFCRAWATEKKPAVFEDPGIFDLFGD